ncbi:MAG TPA: PEGA domain-containing protein, partial [Gemmatimonadales bacterium]|nr:PEGA domain-containing protein [Gemmatimonadales bacterium]
EEVPRMSGKRAGTPEFLSVAIARALAKEPDQRFATMEEFATAVWPEQPVAAPKKGASTGASTSRRRPPPPKQVSPDTPTEMTTAPTTPMPRAGMKIGAEKKKRSGLGLGIGALVLAVVGVGGYVAFANKSAPPPAPQASQTPPPAPPPVTAPVETIRVTANPPPSAPRRTTPPPAPPPAPAAAAARGYLTINSEPPGTVFIDGREIGSVPVIEEPVSVGRHTIRVERPGFKTKTETIDVPANTPVRKRYVLDPEG